jgi:hypothetical protein
MSLVRLCHPSKKKVMLLVWCCGFMLMVQLFYWHDKVLQPLSRFIISFFDEDQNISMSQVMSTNFTPPPHPTTMTTAMMKNTKTPQKLQKQLSPQFPRPKIVILAGPHKTGSTSLQYCMVDWTKNWNTDSIRQEKMRQWKKQQKLKLQDQQQSGREEITKVPTSLLLSETPVLEPLVLPRWAWPIPLGSDMDKQNLLYSHPRKGFASLMAVVDDDEQFTKDHRPLEPSQRRQVDHLFQAAMVEAWQQDFNIVFGSEEFDRISHPKRSKNATEILQSVVNILPWNETIESIQAWKEQENGPAIDTNNQVIPRTSQNITTQRPSLHLKDLEAVIVYRRPRVHHLRSVWHQTGGKNQSFAAFLTTSSDNQHALPNFASFLDTVGLAHRFVQHNIRTTVIDMTGIASIGRGNSSTNLCHVVACDVLRDVECTKDSQILSLFEKTRNVSSKRKVGQIDVSTRKMNQRSDQKPINLTSYQLDAIETVMHDYDCGWKQVLMMSDLFRILHQHGLFVDCKADTPLRTLSWMVEEIRTIAVRGY